METLDKQESNKIERDELGRIKPGYSGNMNGRPKGKTMKEYSREWFLQLTDEEKTAYILALEKVRPGFAWTMAEGNPTEDRNIKVSVPIPILGGSTQNEALNASVTNEIGKEVLSIDSSVGIDVRPDSDISTPNNE